MSNFDEVKGYASIWFGMFDDLEKFEEYISEVYCIYEESMEEFFEHYPGHSGKNVLLESEFNIALNNLFLDYNKDRPFEEELRDFYDESYNQFGYDFGIQFIDEDTIEAATYEETTNSIEKLFNGWDKEIVKRVNVLLGNTLDKSYNAVFIIFNGKYSGMVKSVKNDKFEFDYAGCIEYSV